MECADGRHRPIAPARTWWTAGLVAVALLAGACGGGATGATSTISTPTTPTRPTTPGAPTTPAAPTTPTTGSSDASIGCSRPSAPAGTTTMTATVAGEHRVAVIHLPTSYHPPTPLPLVVNMHGSGSTASEQEVLTGMDATADADDFIVVYPQGDIPEGTGFDWNVPGEPLIGGAAVPADAPDDVSFVERLVALVEQKYCIDPRRVYATGFSGGARMASQLGCDASTIFAAVAPVSGLRFPSPCPSARPVPVVSFHGTADPVDPYNGNGQKYWTYSVPGRGPTVGGAQRLFGHTCCLPTGHGGGPHLLRRLLGWCRSQSLFGRGGGPRMARRTAPSEDDSPGSSDRSPPPSAPTRRCGPSSSPIRSSDHDPRADPLGGARSCPCRRRRHPVGARAVPDRGIARPGDRQASSPPEAGVMPGAASHRH